MNLYIFVISAVCISLAPAILIVLKLTAGLPIPTWIIIVIPSILGFILFGSFIYYFLDSGQPLRPIVTPSDAYVPVKVTNWSPAFYENVGINKIARATARASAVYSYNSFNPALFLEPNQTVIIKVIGTKTIPISDIKYYQLSDKNFLGFEHTELLLRLQDGEGYHAFYKKDHELDEKIHQYFIANGVEKK